MASVTDLMAWWVARRSSNSRSASNGSITGSASNSAQTRCTSREAPSTPAAVHCTSRSGRQIEDAQARGVDPVGVGHVGGRDHVALRLRHLLDVADRHRLASRLQPRAPRAALRDDLHFARFHPFAVLASVGLVRDHALREEARERLAVGHHAFVAQRLGDEPGVKQVQHSVLDAADVLVDRQPVVGRGLVDRFVRLRIDVAVEVPGAIDECVERVGLARRRAAAAGARRVLPGRMPLQRVAGLAEVHALRQPHRQVRLRHGDHATRLAMHDRDRTAPAALARDAPVAQAIDGRAFAQVSSARCGRSRRPWRPRRSRPVHELRIVDVARPDIRLVHATLNVVGSAPGGSSHGRDRGGRISSRSPESRWSWPGQPKMAPVP